MKNRNVFDEPIKKMNKQKRTKHNQQQAVGYGKVIVAMGNLCPVEKDSVAIRFENIDFDRRQGKVQT
jgi:hypothetical protein